ncbi:glycosyltransferase family 2 protein [soil metagenome]
MQVTVIVPVRNEATAIRATLTSLLNQNFPADEYEVIVADGGSEDETVAIVREFQSTHSNLKLLFNPKRWSSAARNLGVRHMRGKVCVVVDGHCQVPSRDYIRNVMTAFGESGADCLGRPQPLDIANPTPFQQAVSAARSSRLGHNPDSDIYSDQPKYVEPQSTAIAYHRDVFRRVGLFDEHFDACEDVEFNQRVFDAGFRCWFTPKLTIVYHPRKTLRGLSTQLMRYGTGRARLAKKHPRSLTLPALVPPLWCVWLVLGAVISLLIPNMIWLYVASLMLYASAILGGSLMLARKQTANVGVRIPGVLLGIHFGFGWGFLRESLRLRS